jgi:hypothetical protein
MKQSVDTTPIKHSFHRRHKNAILLVTLLLIILMSPINLLFKDSKILDMLMATLVMAASLNAISHRKRSTVFWAIALALLYVISGWLHVAFDGIVQQITSHSFASILYIFIASLLFKVILTEDEITVDQIFAAVAIYIFIGLTWAHFYALVGSFDPGSLRGISEIKSHHPADYLYFSFITLTTLGYGDILPTNPASKALVIVESITGVMFVAILVSTLVGRVNMKR